MIAKSEIAKDPRPIEAIHYNDFEGSCFRVGELFKVTKPGDVVTSIVAYDDYGVGDVTPWLAVRCGEEVIARVPAWQVEIHY